VLRREIPSRPLAAATDPDEVPSTPCSPSARDTTIRPNGFHASTQRIEDKETA
jgi:hypothetical protein